MKNNRSLRIRRVVQVHVSTGGRKQINRDVHNGLKGLIKYATDRDGHILVGYIQRDIRIGADQCSPAPELAAQVIGPHLVRPFRHIKGNLSQRIGEFIEIQIAAVGMEQVDPDILHRCGRIFLDCGCKPAAAGNNCKLIGTSCFDRVFTAPILVAHNIGPEVIAEA